MIKITATPHSTLIQVNNQTAPTMEEILDELIVFMYQPLSKINSIVTTLPLFKALNLYLRVDLNLFPLEAVTIIDNNSNKSNFNQTFKVGNQINKIPKR